MILQKTPMNNKAMAADTKGVKRRGRTLSGLELEVAFSLWQKTFKLRIKI